MISSGPPIGVELAAAPYGTGYEPDQIAQEAQRAGLLTGRTIERLIEEAVRRAAGKKLLDAMQRLRDANVPPLTEEDIAEEVRAARAARKGSQAPE